MAGLRGTLAAALAAIALSGAPGPAEAAGCTPPGPLAGGEDAFGPLRESGIAPAAPPREARGAASLRALAAGPPARRSAVPGEALLVLPKGPDGRVPTGFDLAPGVRVGASYWSAVVCATVARLAGPLDVAPRDWLRDAPPRVSLVPNHVYVPAAERRAAAPDPYRRFQYGLDRIGAARARGVSDGAGVRVAVLDSAPETRHRDLRAVRLLPPAGGGDGEAPPGVHGTLVAGILGATEGNGFGIVGVAPGAEILAVPVCRPGEGGAEECPLYDLLRGADAAFAAEAQIVNLSLVGPPNPLLEQAMARLDQLGVVVVAAAGNENTDEPRYPAAYPSVVGVAAVDRDDRRFARGNRGPSAEIDAPGVEIISTVPGDAFAFGDGTSLAAAHVSGVLALLTAVTGDAPRARAALFQRGTRGAAAERAASGPGVAGLPEVCDVLADLGRACAD